jgi:ribonuclease T1
VFLPGQPALRRTVRKLGLAFALAAMALTPGIGDAKESKRELVVISLSALPAEAQATEQLIRAGGPFPHSKDGTTFGNRERLLPAQRRGYYREYTVRTPGARDRGARRIVCGGSRAVAPEACYYTEDHYASFRRIAQ